MATVNALRAQLQLAPLRDDEALESVGQALRLCPERPAREVMLAAGGLAAGELLPLPGLGVVLDTLRDAVMSPHPEQALTRLLAQWTGGLAEIVASWGDLVATAGRAAGPELILRLEHRERHVGALRLAVPERWQGLAAVAAEYALLARLQSAAAGAARRRVGERVLEGLLSGSGGGDVLGSEPFAVAVASFPLPLSSAGGLRGREDALDVLAAVGEGYLMERRLAGYSTVRSGEAVWLWSSLHLPTEGRELHAALLASTAQDVRLGVSSRHAMASQGAAAAVQTAYREARQALAATRSRRGVTPFQEMDPLFALLSDGRLTVLQSQVQTRLSALADDGRIEATLRAYLAHRGPLGDLATRLDIHVNTLRARLRRAEEALGGSLSDPAVLARLYLAFGAGSGAE
ncbi:PucR family transcriptional regulator [Deinococcus koreensis]|uniref:Transcriptional regulator n=1 Tax=Deinococcus koreensis TaxID=2054903 RepID=A0A2K3UST3_9DEIO|nr:helix-turn-helix domain-containing protein [Deinococcus koreensis]PNY79605.1 transcriptional regulator [Deinococcus koreensis]